MNANAATMPTRIAAGVTATYLRELSRRSAPEPHEERRAGSRGHDGAATHFGRDRDECGRRGRARPRQVR
jgi:hypothetical protein